MRCEQIRDLLSPYMDNMTNEKETRLVEVHLAGCSACKNELEQMKLISGFLKGIEAPPCPESFSADLHKRILEEKSKVFSLREAAKPKRQGWLAAGIAGIALLIGIYASSILPLANIADLWKGKDSDSNKNVAIVDKDPLSRIIGITGISKTGKDTGIISAEKGDQNGKGENVVADGNSGVSSKTPGNNSSKPSGTSPYLSEQVAAQIKVGDVNKSAAEVMKLAQANGAEYRMVAGTDVEPLSGGQTKEIELRVEKDKTEAVLMQLSNIGEVTATSLGKAELTDQYNKVQEEIAALNEQIDKAKSGEDDANKLQELEKKLRECNQLKNDLEAEMNKVTLKVYLVEEVKP